MLQVFYEIAFKEPKPMMVDSGVYFNRVRVRLKELTVKVVVRYVLIKNLVSYVL